MITVTKKKILFSLIVFFMLMGVTQAVVPPIPYPISNPLLAEEAWNFNDTAVSLIGKTDGTLGSGCSYNADTPLSSGKSLYCDGSTDGYFDTNWQNLSLLDAYSFSYWWKNTIDNGAYIYGSQVTGSYAFLGWADSGLLYNYNFDASNAFYTTVPTSNFGSDTEWKHIVITKEAGSSAENISNYINGVYVGAINNSAIVSDVSFSVDLFWFCRNNGGCSDPQDGYMADLLIYNKALNQTEITTIYTGDYPDAPVALTNSTWEYTNPNIVSGEVNTTWDTGGTINVTSNNASFTFTASVASNWSCSPYNYNYTNMIAWNSSSKLSTTDVTEHALTTYPFQMTKSYGKDFTGSTSDYFNFSSNEISVAAGDIFFDFDLGLGMVIDGGVAQWSAMMDSNDCTSAVYGQVKLDLVNDKFVCVNTTEGVRVIEITSQDVDFNVVNELSQDICIYCSGIAGGAEYADSTSGCLPLNATIPSPTASDWNVTSGNTYRTESTSSWNINNTVINITNGTLSYTFTCSAACNHSAYVDVATNYSVADANHKAATTETISQANTAYDTISVGDHYLYISLIGSNGLITNYIKNFTYLEVENINFTYTPATEYGEIVNSSLWGNWTGTWEQMQNNISALSSGTLAWFALEEIKYGDYMWNVQVCGEKNLCNFTSINSTFTVPIDTDEGPNVTLNEPLDNANIYYYTQKDDGMKLNFSATNDVGLKNCSLWLTDETNSNFKYNQTYSNSTPLVVDDLTDIDISGLTNQSYGSALGIVIVAANANETAGSIIGQIAVDQDTYTDGTGIISPLYVQLTISEGVSLPNIYTGDTINITYDSGKTTKIYLPESSATQAYYIGGDGSTWNSINTTTYKLYDLAYPAPPLNNTITNFNVIFSRGIYTWNVQCYDNISQVGWGINRTFNITNTAPTWIANISNTTQLEDFTTFTYLDNLTSYVTDLDGDTVTFSIQDENTSQVNCAIVGTQNLTLTSVTNWYGNSTCSVGITDSLVYGENNTFGIEVTSVNDNPYFDPALINKSTNTSTTFIYDINCTDVDVGAVVTYYDNTTIFDINSTTGEISQLVNEKWRGNNSILITCGDGIVNTSSPFVLEVNDTTAPRYVSSVATELTIDFCAVNGTETINATFDDWYLDSSSTVYFAHNDTGIWVNTSATFEVSENASRHTWSYSIPAGWSNPGEKNYRFIAIDNANNINATGMDISEFYITKNISTLTLYLNGQAIDRKYELGTTANLTGTLNSCGGAGTVWLDISDPNYGVNYTSGTNGEVSYDYQILNIAETEFSDGTTSKNLTYVPGNQTFDIELMGESTFSTAHVYPYGYLNTTYPSNLVVDIFQDGTIDAILPGTLIGNTTNQSTFSAGVTTENLTFPVASSIVRWINFSTNQENDFFGFSLPNITIDLSGGAIDPVGVDYYDYFDNTSYPYSVNTCQGPSYIWDDFSQGDVVDRWSGDYTITASTYIRGDDEYCTAPLVYSGSEGSCDAAGSCETTTYFNSETLVLEDRPSTTFKLVHSTVLSSANFGLCSKSVSCKSHATTGILDKTTNIYAIMRSSSDTNTFNGIVEIKRENGFLKWYQDDIYMKQMSYNSTHQYEIKSTVTFVQRRNERGTVTCHGAVYIYPINVSGSAGAGGMGNYAECKMEYTDLLDVTGGGVPISRGIFEFDSEEIGSAGTYTLYLSADNGSNWEEVTNGLSHVFTNVGTMLAGKLVLNTTVSTDTVVAKEVHISVVPGFASGIGIDVGYDGDTEWNMTAQLNATTSPQHITLDATDLYTDISDCTGLTCLVPIVFKVDTAGTLTYSNITIKQQFGKIFLNVTAINNNLTDIVGLSNITIGVGSDTAGIVELSDLTVDYKGDATYSINAHFEGNENYSVANDTHDLSWRYSPITLTWPSRITSYNVYPSTINSKNVEPLGQKTKLTEAESVPIFNITTTARTDNVKIYSLFDPAIDSCLTLNECLYVNKSLCIPTNTTGQLLVSNLAPGEEANLYHYWNLTNCDPSNIYLPTNFSHRPYCQDCVYTGE